MKRKNLLLAVLALTLVLGAGAGSAWAYFTTYAQAQGGRILRLGDETEITERFSDWTKRVVITSDPDSEPVYVRAKAFAPEGYELTYSDGEERWSPGPDDYLYYSEIIGGGESTGELLVRIDGIPEGELLEDGANFNVIVIYESLPVQYGADGEPVPPQELDWTQAVVNGEGGE